jgi:hypothetical protein
MTWTAALLPDDALEPDSLVGRMLDVKPTSNSDQIRSSEPPPPATVEPMPLWRVMAKSAPAGAIFGTPGVVERRVAAEIEALRDMMLPEEFIPRSAQGARVAVAKERQRLRAWLTGQAHIAREG